MCFQKKESLTIIPLIGLFSGILPFSIIAFGILKTVYRFKIHHIKIKSEVVPQSLRNLKIVQILNLHVGSFNYRYAILDRAVTLINELKPEIIVFTGDFVNKYAWKLWGWAIVFSKLLANKGKFAVLENQDYGDFRNYGSITL